MEYTRNNSFPTKGDKLFISIPHDGKWLPSGIDDIFKLSEGYRLSAVSLYQEIKKSEWLNKQYLLVRESYLRILNLKQLIV